MARGTVLLALTSWSACAGGSRALRPEAFPSRAAGPLPATRGRPEPGARPPGPAPAASAGLAAAAPDAASAALVLADARAGAGDLDGALELLQQALADHPERLDLALARGRLLRDLGALDAAAVALVALSQRHPEAVPVRIAAARAEALRGRPAVALALLRAGFGRDGLTPGAVAELAAVERDLVAACAGRPHYDAAELAALARGAGSAVRRVRALRTLAQASPGGLERALAAALADAEPAVRVFALRLAAQRAAGDVDGLVALLRPALADEAPMVRGAAARIGARLPAAAGVPLLLAILDSEENGYVFRGLHEALGVLLDDDRLLSEGDEHDAAARARTRAQWRQTWRR